VQGVPTQHIAKRITVTVGSTSMEYSVLEYLYTRIYVSEGVTDQERYMYQMLIDYAEKFDVALNKVAQSSIKNDHLVIVTNGTLDGTVSSDLFSIGDKPFANVDTELEIADGKELAWQVSVNGGESVTYTTDELKGLSISGHTVVTAVEKEEEVKEKKWVLVTDASQLKVGAQIVIVASDSDLAMSTNQNNNNRGQVEISKDGNTVVINDNVQILTLENGTIAGTFAFNTGSGYLYAASSSSNHLKTKSSLDANGSWNITIENGVATVKAQGNYTKNWLRYNSGSSLFSCYSSGQQNISIYILTE
jgi:hypothetical protein